MVIYSIIFFWGLHAGRDFLVPLCISALLAFLILPLMRFLTTHRVPEWLAITLSTAALILPFVFLGVVLVREGQSFVDQIPNLVKSLEGWTNSVSQSQFAHRFHLESSLEFSALAEKLGSSFGTGAVALLTGLGSILSSAALLVLVLIITVVMVASRKHLKVSSVRLLRQFETVHADNLLNEVTQLIEQFLLARFIIMIISGIASTALIFAFGVPYSILLGCLIGLLTIVPEVGYVLSVVPLIIVSIVSGHSAGSILLLQALLFVVHIIEGNVLTPKLVGNRLNINVLAGFIVLFGGGLIWGVWGMLLSIPILGIVRIVLCASPTLAPWGLLLSERDDRVQSKRLRRPVPRIFGRGKSMPEATA